MSRTSTVPLEGIVEISADQVSAALPGEAVILSLRDGTYYGLNAVGARIWELIHEPTRIADVIERLLAEYDVDRHTCTSEVMDFLQQVLDWELVVLRDGEGTAK